MTAASLAKLYAARLRAQRQIAKLEPQLNVKLGRRRVDRNQTEAPTLKQITLTNRGGRVERMWETMGVRH